MSTFSIAILVTHYLLVGLLCVYGAHRVYHVFLARRWQLAQDDLTIRSSASELGADAPLVTIQAPVFNERFVVERLIDSLVALDYPADKLQIQIIDDSTDDSIDIAAARIAYHRDRGVNINHVLRENREGFKAGALDAAMASVTGEFIAIFDADFSPKPDFLKKTIPAFSDPQLGMVQTRWLHLNIDSNMLTRVQAIMLDAHFAIEQVARAHTGAFFNFNGTAGVWRRVTIEDSGGWLADTLTEDLDLSYRAQMKGWHFKYARNIGCPSELPTNMSAFKTQQHRWAKGAIEVMKKTLADIWKSPVSPHAKIEATFHLTGNIAYMLMFFDTLFFLIPSVHIRETAGWSFLTWFDIPLFFFASLSHAWFFLYSQKLLYGRVANKLPVLPLLLATSIGLSVNNGRAVIEALIGHVTDFIRTPKTGALTSAAQPSFKSLSSRVNYKAASALWADRLELCLAAIYASYLAWAISKGYFIVVPFLALFAIGFLFTGTHNLIAKTTHPARARL